MGDRGTQSVVRIQWWEVLSAIVLDDRADCAEPCPRGLATTKEVAAWALAQRRRAQLRDRRGVVVGVHRSGQTAGEAQECRRLVRLGGTGLSRDWAFPIQLFRGILRGAIGGVIAERISNRVRDTRLHCLLARWHIQLDRIALGIRD